MDLPERIWQLIAKALNGEASSQEKEELLHLLHQNPSLRQQYELLVRIWDEKHDHPGDEEDAKRHISRIINRAQTETIYDEELMVSRRSRRRRRIITLTSLVAAAILISGWFFISSSSN